MKVSIITTCYNRAKTIRETIESVLSQDYPNVEYIIIDGASTDDTMSIVNEYAGRIHVVKSEPDKGMYEGINKGLRIATGDVVGLMHSDDVYYATDTISRIVKEFERTGADLVYGNGLFVKPADLNCVVRDWISGGFVKNKIRRGWLPLHTTVYVKREMFEKYGYYDEQYKIAADSEWLVRCLYKHSVNVSYINEYIVKMRMGGASTSIRLTKRKWQEDLKLYHRHGLSPYISVTCKVISKVPQFVAAKVKHWIGVF
ncbi:MAG: glycosyltransferase [Bacteroidales bacterium]|nr:glycosyltransferase [Bacteroidales bacterium]